MPPDAVIGVSWILCAFAFSFLGTGGLVDGAPAEDSPRADTCRITSALRSLAARFEIARQSAFWCSGCNRVLGFGLSNPFPLLRC